MTKIIRSKSYVFTADVNSAADMQQIDIVKKSVKSMNATAKQAHVYACRRAEYRNEPLPKAPTRYRVRLMGRGPRKASYNDNLYKGGNPVSHGYSIYLPQEYALKFDVYISEVR